MQRPGGGTPRGLCLGARHDWDWSQRRWACTGFLRCGGLREVRGHRGSALWCWELIFAPSWQVLLLVLPVRPASQAPVQPVSTVAGAQPAWQMLGAVLTLALPHPFPGTWQPAGRPSTWHHLCLFLPDLGRA